MTNWSPKVVLAGRFQYHAIVEALAHDIASGVLQPGQKLPTHRELARSLNVAVGTVSKAYAEAKRQGYVRSGVGSGTFVIENPWAERRRFRTDTRDENKIDLSFNTPVLSNFHSEALKKTLARISERSTLCPLLGYQRPWIGNDRHRQAGASWLGRFGMTTNSSDVAVVSGAQHGISVVLLTRTNVGDIVVTDELTDPLTKLIVSAHGRNLRGLQTDRDGLLPEALEAACKTEDVKALVCAPDHHSPTATIMSEQRRMEIAEIARRFAVPIIENAVYRPILSVAPRPIASFAPELSYYVSSLSKIVAPGLRIGFVAAPETRRDELMLGMGATTWMAPSLIAEVAATWIEDGVADHLAERQRNELSARNAIAVKLLKGFNFQGLPSGMHIWLRLPEPWSTHSFVAQARSRNVLVTPAEAFSTSRTAVPHSVRLSLGGAVSSEEELVTGLHTIVDILSGKVETSYLPV